MPLLASWRHKNDLLYSFWHTSWLDPLAVDDAQLMLNALLCAAAGDGTKKDATVIFDALLLTIWTVYPTPRAKHPDLKGRKTFAKRSTLQLGALKSLRPYLTFRKRMKPPTVVAALLMKPFTDTACDICTHGHASSVSPLLLEVANETNCVPQYTQALRIAAHIAHHTNPFQCRSIGICMGGACYSGRSICNLKPGTSNKPPKAHLATSF